MKVKKIDKDEKHDLEFKLLAVQGRTWDSVPVPHVDVADLDNDSIKLFKKMALDHNRLDSKALDVPTDVLLRNLRLFENDYLTRAAVMCFHPDPEKWVMCAYTKIGFFADNDADIIYQDEVHGFFFPKEAFRELLLNAVIHRDYTRPTPIQIRVYAHKIRIWNIGKMPVDVPVEKLFKPHSSEPRNPNIANVFFKAGYVESWGRGYKNITDVCKLRKAKLPKPEENSGGLMVECPPSRQYLDAERKQGKIIPYEDAVNPTVNPTVKLSKNQKDILVKITENSKITLTELAGLLGLNRSTIADNTLKLQRLGVLKRVGSDKTGYWEVIF